MEEDAQLPDFDYDFRLLEVTGELFALREHLKLIEEGIERIKKAEELKLRETELPPDDPEWDSERQQYEYLTEDLLPRFFRGTFLVSLYAVYESAITEVARMIGSRKAHAISIDDLRGNFLDRASKFYKDILQFELWQDQKEQQRIRMLSDLRNTFAHANGRFEMLNDSSKKRVKHLTKTEDGIKVFSGYVVCDAKITSDIFLTVQNSLSDLVARYKKWDDDFTDAESKL